MGGTTLVVTAWVAVVSLGGEGERPSEAARREILASFPKSILSTTPEDAMLLRILVETRKAQRGVEVGSYVGFGACNMGIAFERTGGHLTTIEIDPATADRCRENIRRMGLEKSVACVTGDALKVLPMLEGQFDFVFIDAAKNDYFKYLKAIEPKLKAGAVVVADNTIQSAGAMRDFLDYLATSPNYETVTVRASDAKKDGMTIAVKLR
ncbi:MAG: methyltransferase domain-containing protein [Planctomycetes bacterium]|nr:methyltransferase domain-containing protein [Planctomycetota bacterium]